VIVFAPHQDDETLGCGGTILQKVNAGQELVVVFMTDGSTSHANFLPVSELIETRKLEAMEACKVLGVPESRVHFLGFPDGFLFREQQMAIERVKMILGDLSPDEIFVPSRLDGTPDHVATNRIVHQAIKNTCLGCIVYEYPIWYWLHWPWISIFDLDRYFIKMWLAHSLKTGFGFSAHRYFNTSVEVTDVLEIKKNALYKHQTQMIKPENRVDWPVLGEIAQGDFLNCFFQDREYFFSYATASEEIA
jgi:LmbE family N-acetylglucosaminyl deacetylase